MVTLMVHVNEALRKANAPQRADFSTKITQSNNSVKSYDKNAF